MQGSHCFINCGLSSVEKFRAWLEGSHPAILSAAHKAGTCPLHHSSYRFIFIPCPGRPHSSCCILPGYARSWASFWLIVTLAWLRFLLCSCWPSSLRGEKRDLDVLLLIGLGLSCKVVFFWGICRLADAPWRLPPSLCLLCRQKESVLLSTPASVPTCRGLATPGDLGEVKCYLRNLLKWRLQLFMRREFQRCLRKLPFLASPSQVSRVLWPLLGEVSWLSVAQ